jgi:shikimate kinase
MSRPVYLWGLSGCGKSTIAPLVAEKTRFNSIDLDEVIEKKSTKNIHDLFYQEGEVFFREIESGCLKELSAGQNFVMATGGGTPCFFDNAGLMLQNGICIYLKTGISGLVERLHNEKTSRPLFSGLDDESMKQKLISMLNQREKYYNLAHFVVSTDNKSPQKIVAEIGELLLFSGLI